MYKRQARDNERRLQKLEADKAKQQFQQWKGMDANQFNSTFATHNASLAYGTGNQMSDREKALECSRRATEEKEKFEREKQEREERERQEREERERRKKEEDERTEAAKRMGRRRSDGVKIVTLKKCKIMPCKMIVEFFFCLEQEKLRNNIL